MTKAIKITPELALTAGPPVAGLALSIWNAHQAAVWFQTHENMSYFAGLLASLSPTKQAGGATIGRALGDGDAGILNSELSKTLLPLAAGTAAGVGARGVLWVGEKAAGRQGGAALRKLEKKTIVTI